MNYEHDRGKDRGGEPSLAQMTSAAIGETLRISAALDEAERDHVVALHRDDACATQHDAADRTVLRGAQRDIDAHGLIHRLVRTGGGRRTRAPFTARRRCLRRFGRGRHRR